MAFTHKRSIPARVFSAALILQTAGCGTLMYPERRGTIDGRIDAGVAILDGVGLLFFIIPGLIAYGVDFSTGAIYLPHTAGHHHRRRSSGTVDLIYVPPQDLDPARLEAVLERETGLPKLLTNPALTILSADPHTPPSRIVEILSNTSSHFRNS